jgi:hypothetical protein
MGTKEKYYRTIVEIEVLSQYEITEQIELEGLVYEITYGDCSGAVKIKSSREVGRKKMAKLLELQGSADFFFFDEDEDEEEEGFSV